MIAVRLRVTGHSQAEIEDAIRPCAPGIRGPHDQAHRWDDYARQTVGYAFGYQGSRQVEQLEKYKGEWEKLEKGGQQLEADTGAGVSDDPFAKYQHARPKDDHDEDDLEQDAGQSQSSGMSMER